VRTASRPWAGRRPAADWVLVIDDDATARELIADHLKSEGFSVVTASGGLEGLKLAKQVKPTVITLDVSLVVRACHSLGDSGRLAYSIIIELQTDWSYDRRIDLFVDRYDMTARSQGACCKSA